MNIHKKYILDMNPLYISLGDLYEDYATDYFVFRQRGLARMKCFNKQYRILRRYYALDHNWRKI